MSPAGRESIAAPAKHYRLEVVGISRGNPGLAGAGTVIRDVNGRTVEQHSHYLGPASPMQAEYEALIRGLEAVARRKPESLEIVVDNDQVCRQITGRSTGHPPEVLALYVRVQELLSEWTELAIRSADQEALFTAAALANVGIDSRGRRQAID